MQGDAWKAGRRVRAPPPQAAPFLRMHLPRLGLGTVIAQLLCCPELKIFPSREGSKEAPQENQFIGEWVWLVKPIDRRAGEPEDSVGAVSFVTLNTGSSRMMGNGRFKEG